MFRPTRMSGRNSREDCQIWREPATRSVTVSARELAILAGVAPAHSRGAKHQLIFGVSADDGPSSMAQRYARLLCSFQEPLQRELGEKTVFHLRLFKRFNRNQDTLVRGEADLLVLSAVDFLRAAQAESGVRAVARATSTREGVIFTRTNFGLRQLADVRGHSLILPDPDLSLTVWAKARLVEAGLSGRDFRLVTNILDQGAEVGSTVISVSETMEHVLRGEWEVGVSPRGQFERYRHLGLVELARFADTPNVLAARAGLDARLVAALGKALRSRAQTEAWPEQKFVAEPFEREVEGSSLEALRRAMEVAARFGSSRGP